MGWQWAWAAEPPVCGARQFSDAELRRQLAGKSVLLLGDSHTRAMYTYLTRMLNGTFSSAIDVFSKGWNSDGWHGNSSTGARAATPGAADLHVQLLWHTAVPQIRDVLKKMHQQQQYPGVVILSLGNWYHQLNRTEAQLEADLAELAGVVAGMDAAARAAGRDILWLQVTLPTRIHGRSSVSTWNTPPALIPRYNAILRASPLVHPAGPVLLLDLHALAEPCLVWCSPDGLHANAAVNAVAIQIIANLLGLPRQ